MKRRAKTVSNVPSVQSPSCPFLAAQCSLSVRKRISESHWSRIKKLLRNYPDDTALFSLATWEQT